MKLLEKGFEHAHRCESVSLQQEIHAQQVSEAKYFHLQDISIFKIFVTYETSIDLILAEIVRPFDVEDF